MIIGKKNPFCYLLFINLKTSIPQENEYLGAFDRMVWNSFWNKNPKWNESMHSKLKKGESFSSLSMKLLRPLKPNQKSYTFKKFKDLCKDDDFNQHGTAHYGTSKFYCTERMNLAEFLESESPLWNKSFYTHIIWTPQG